jgi:sterol desaturase/sphingolipid hydroxylase (fatty acid hydroxylase superfamily)
MAIGSLITRVLPVLIALGVASAIEILAPLRRQPRLLNGRLATNLALLAITLSLGMLLNFVLAIGAAYVDQHGTGLLQLLKLGPIITFIVAFLALDGASYLVHRLMHQTPAFWRFHVVHHIDASVDATTGFRQHPFDGLLRFCFIAAPAWLLGAPPAAIAVFRVLSAVNSALEHANIRVPRLLDRCFVSLWVTPDMHKVHHSRTRTETDSNYANLFSFFDRLFGTYTPSSRGPSVIYGIDGYDGPEHQSVLEVLLLPLRRSSASRNPAASPVGNH